MLSSVLSRARAAARFLSADRTWLGWVGPTAFCPFGNTIWLRYPIGGAGFKLRGDGASEPPPHPSVTSSIRLLLLGHRR